MPCKETKTDQVMVGYASAPADLSVQ